MEATLEKLKKSSVSEAMSARVRMIKYSFLHLNLMNVKYRLGNMTGTGEQQYLNKGDEAGWVRRSQIM